jgi:hypothetical protein
MAFRMTRKLDVDPEQAKLLVQSALLWRESEMSAEMRDRGWHGIALDWPHRRAFRMYLERTWDTRDTPVLEGTIKQRKDGKATIRARVGRPVPRWVRWMYGMLGLFAAFELLRLNFDVALAAGVFAGLGYGVPILEDRGVAYSSHPEARMLADRLDAVIASALVRSEPEPPDLP